MSDADFIREVEELYLRLANADTDDLVELAKLAGLDPKTDLADSVWVPYPSFGEFRQNTLAAVVLTDYLEEHGIEVDAAAADNAQVVLPKLGKLEAVLIPQDSGGELLDLSQVRVEIDLNPATLAYILVELGEGGAWLTGVLLSSDLRQDFPEGGAVSLAMRKPISVLWEAYHRWEKCQQIMARCSDEQGWSAEQRAEVITVLNWLLTHRLEYERPKLLGDFLAEKASENNENFKPLVSRPEGVREATPKSSSEGADDTYQVDTTTYIITENANEGTDTVESSVTYTLNLYENSTLTGNILTGGAGVDWLTVAMDLLDELGKFI